MSKVISLDKQKEKEILFFKSTKPINNKHMNNVHVLFILMSHKIDEEGFYKLFPDTQKVTQEEFDELYKSPLFSTVVPVGDDDIIDEYFNDL